MDIKEFLLDGHKSYLPNLSIDHVIIGYEQKQLKCLLLRIGDKWILPGGYIGRNESVDGAAARILQERTGLENAHLKFLAVFGEPSRKFQFQWKELVGKVSDLPPSDDYWINDRFVTLAHYSLVHIEKIELTPGEFDEEIAWHPFDNLPSMWLDHREIVFSARNQLKSDLKHEQLSYNLLPAQFTMPELHQLHQHILQQNLDRSRFQKKMLASGHFERLPKLHKETPGRNPYLYRVKPSNSTL
jgi:8-oxo-dGTP diphosphatase